MIESRGLTSESTKELIALYDAHVGTVYRYLYRRCSDRSTAEELTADTFLGVLDGLRSHPPRSADVAWLLGIARHKLADYWRRRERDDRNLRIVAENIADDLHDWQQLLDAGKATEVLNGMPPQYRLVLTLRYLDDLPVIQIAELIQHSTHGTESMLARARRAFRDAYTAGETQRDD